MAFPFLAPLIGGAIGAIGSAFSAFGKKDPTYNYQDTSLGNQFAKDIDQYRYGLNQALSGDYAAGQQASRGLADLLMQYQATGGVPQERDISAGQSYAQSQFAPQQMAMQQAFQDQLTQANRQAALSGRGINDPILKAKLAQEQTRQQALLGSQQGAFAAQAAQGISSNRLAFAGQRANVLNQLGQQSVSQQQNLLAQALSGLQGERGFAQNQANMRFNEAANQQTFAQRLGSTFSGGLAGLGAGASMASLFKDNPFADWGSEEQSSGNYSVEGGMGPWGSQYQSVASKPTAVARRPASPQSAGSFVDFNSVNISPYNPNRWDNLPTGKFIGSN